MKIEKNNLNQIETIKIEIDKFERALPFLKTLKSLSNLYLQKYLFMFNTIVDISIIMY